jgi:cytochrome c oxidase subunit I
MSNTARVVFSFITFLVAVPSGVKIFNWVATMYKGSIDLKPPLIYALSFIFLFMIGGLTGLVVGALSTDIHVHDTYFVVAHFHYTMFGGTGFAFLGAIHYWFPKIYGKIYNFKTAIIGWAIFFVGFNLLYIPMFIIGIEGMPRRYYDYLPQFTNLNRLSTIGSWLLAIGLFIIFYNLIRGVRKGQPATQNIWNGKTLEWQTESPPSLENFEEIPVVTELPYNY